MIRSTGPLCVFILSALAPDPLPIKIQPVLLRVATSIGHFADQYWLEKRPI